MTGLSQIPSFVRHPGSRAEWIVFFCALLQHLWPIGCNLYPVLPGLFLKRDRGRLGVS